MAITVSALSRSLVRRRVEAQMSAQIRVLRGELGSLDPATGQVGGITGATTVYAGKARIRTVAAAGVLAVGEGSIDTRQALVSIPITAAVPRRDDLIAVAANGAADPSLDTRIFRVTEVDAGGLFGDARRMTAVGWYESRYWNAQ